MNAVALPNKGSKRLAIERKITEKAGLVALTFGERSVETQDGKREVHSFSKGDLKIETKQGYIEGRDRSIMVNKTLISYNDERVYDDGGADDGLYVLGEWENVLDEFYRAARTD